MKAGNVARSRSRSRSRSRREVVGVVYSCQTRHHCKLTAAVQNLGVDANGFATTAVSRN